MNKIIYLKQEVKLGEMIMYQGLTVEVTQTLIDGNPDVFKVIDLDQSMKVIDLDQSMKDKAKMDYPIGTIFNNGSGVQKVIDDTYYWSTVNKKISVPTDKYPEGGIIYHPIDGWAPILPYLFTSEDGVKIHKGMKTYLVAPNNSVDIYFRHSLWSGDVKRRKDYKYFYHKENALAYIRKLKEKTLDDYEEILAKSESSIILSGGNTYFSIYSWIRDNESKLYYTKILQLIADDLNGVRYIHERGQKSFHINKEGGVNLHMGADEGAVYFKEYGLAKKARDILGGKVKYIFD